MHAIQWRSGTGWHKAERRSLKICERLLAAEMATKDLRRPEAVGDKKVSRGEDYEEEMGVRGGGG